MSNNETKQEVRTFLVNKRCYECGNGEYEPTGTALMSNPPQYPHVCNNCGDERNLRQTYPDLRYEPI